MTEPTPDPSENWLDPIFNAVVSDILASGYFDKVNLHELKRKPGKGLWAAVWVQSIRPLPAGSGLASTSIQLLLIVRMYSNMLKEPQDAIDPALTKACSSLMRRYHDDFDFGLHPVVRNVDLLGTFGVALEATAGYQDMDESTTYRIMDLTLPIIVNDVWTQNG